MKRIVLFLGLVAFAIGMFSQATYDVIVRSNNYGYFTGSTTDLIQNAGTADAVFYLPSVGSWYTLSYMLDIDTLSGGGNDAMTIQPQGSYDGTTYTNIGSAITYAATADTAFNVRVHTTVSIADAGTNTTAAFNVIADTTGLTNYPADTLAYAQQTQTVAITRTITIPGVDYRYIKLLITGGGASNAELQLAAIKVTPIEIPK